MCLFQSKNTIKPLWLWQKNQTIPQNWEKSVEFWHRAQWGLFNRVSKLPRMSGQVSAGSRLLSDGFKNGDPDVGREVFGMHGFDSERASGFMSSQSLGVCFFLHCPIEKGEFLNSQFCVNFDIKSSLIIIPIGRLIPLPKMKNTLKWQLTWPHPCS